MIVTDPRHRGWAIVSDARMGSGLGVGHVVLVDQQLDNTLWWTSDDPTIIMRYHIESTAHRAAARFRHGNPRVVRFEVAAELLAAQNRNIAMRTLEKES